MTSSASAAPVKAIWAQARDDAGRPVIGRDGDMPWNLPEDLARFQSLTRGHAVIMGRRTWESLPDRFRPLPGRVNIVVTSRGPVEGAHTATSLADALATADALEASGDLATHATRWIIGGERLFREAIGDADTAPRADEVEVTQIKLVTPGDAFAPVLDAASWMEVARSERAVSSSGLAYRFVTYRALTR